MLIIMARVERLCSSIVQTDWRCLQKVFGYVGSDSLSLCGDQAFQ